MQDSPSARQASELAHQIAGEPGDVASSLLWVGKSYAAIGETGPAKVAWLEASNADPTGSYSVRAADLMEARAMFDAGGVPNFDVDLDTERREAETWLWATFPFAARRRR